MSSEPADFLDAMAEYQRQIVLAAGLGSEVFMLSGAVVVIDRHSAVIAHNRVGPGPDALHIALDALLTVVRAASSAA